MRGVLDTNVLISAFVFPGGTPESVYCLALEGHEEIATSRALLAEFGRVLEQSVIISGDRHLLALGAWSGIEILSPAEVMARWRG